MEFLKEILQDAMVMDDESIQVMVDNGLGENTRTTLVWTSPSHRKSAKSAAMAAMRACK